MTLVQEHDFVYVWLCVCVQNWDDVASRLQDEIMIRRETNLGQISNSYEILSLIAFNFDFVIKNTRLQGLSIQFWH